MATEPLELLQFLHSHYNEKVRWALAWKRVPHRKTTLLPGPHAFSVLRLTGQTQTPVVRVDGRVIAGSARILTHLGFPALATSSSACAGTLGPRRSRDPR